MQCPKCGFEQVETNIECSSCGVIFKKYREIQQKNAAGASGEKPKDMVFDDERVSAFEYIKNLLFYVKPENNPLIVGGRVVVFIAVIIWGLIFIFTPFQTNYAMESFWHLVNLPFHEAGHVVFRLFGRFMTSLGGSLGQLLMPFVCMVTFLVKTRDAFAASFALWWLGESFMDLAPYINDSKALIMPLIGGNTGRTSPYGFHDWEFILKETGLINHYHGIACAFQTIGIILMLISFIWGGYIISKQLKLLMR